VGQTFKYKSALFEQRLPSSMTGQELYYEIELTDPSAILGNRITEYCLLDSSNYGQSALAGAGR
jgi:hypothetical protein